MKCFLYTSILFGGGAERVLCQLASQLSRNHEVTLIASYRLEREYEVEPAVRKIYIDGSAEDKKSFRQVLRLRKLIRSEQPDLVISFLPHPNYKMLIATMGLRCKKLISVRNDPAKEYPTRAYRVLAKALYPLADGIVFQTEDAAAWFPRNIRKKSRIIMNQVAEKFFLASRVSEECYVATGRLNEQKNYGMMIDAFARFVQSHPDQILRIYGDGSLRQQLDRKIKDCHMEDHIYLMGPTDDVVSVLAHARGFLLSSDFEGMPNGLLEALAMGLPCISTDCPCGGPGTVIRHGENGLLTPVRDTNSFYESLCKLEENGSFRKTLAENAKKSAEIFHPGNVFQSWMEYIETVVRE